MIFGKIEKKEIDEGISTSTGKPYTRYVFHVDGKKYSSFNRDLAENFKIGDKVEILGEQKGKYFNMTDMKMYSGNGQETQNNASEGLKSPKTQEQIGRMNCLGHAMEYAKYKKLDMSSPRHVCVIAEIFYHYITKGDFEEEKKEDPEEDFEETEGDPTA